VSRLARAVSDQALAGRIAEIHTDSLKTYGSPHIHAELRLVVVALNPPG
jgi:hypothetical protein